jgi:hypothetical protein
MCPNCVLNQSAPFAYLGPGLICLLFLALGFFFYYMSKKAEGNHQNVDEEDAKYSVFED